MKTETIKLQINKSIAQDISSIDRTIDRQIKRSSHLSLTTAFRRCRKLERTSLLGDYVVLSQIIFRLTREHRKAFSRSQVLNAINLSKELKVLDKHFKSSIINNLIEKA